MRIDSETVPINQRLCLTLEEAALYSGLPLSNIKAMAHADNCSFTFNKPSRGRKLMIKREAFEEFIKNA